MCIRDSAGNRSKPLQTFPSGLELCYTCAVIQQALAEPEQRSAAWVPSREVFNASAVDHRPGKAVYLPSDLRS
eukprot:750588-Alexandrium_andersonii.AAC.1